jgi:hypothetical protein
MTLRIFTTETARNDLQNIKYQAVKISSLCHSIRPETVLSVFSRAAKQQDENINDGKPDKQFNLISPLLSQTALRASR